MKEVYNVRSINVGLPLTIVYEGRGVPSAINKHPITESVYLSKINFKGDKQADLENHGGPDKAVCAYAFDHYSFWAEEFGEQLRFPSFGENLTIEGLTEDIVHIGDTFRLGEAVLQVTQPRQPCYKLAAKLGKPDMVLQVRNTGYSGYYFRVLEEGNVSVGDELVLLERDPAEVSISFVNRILFHETDNVEGLKKVLSTAALAEDLRERLQGRLDGLI